MMNIGQRIRNARISKELSQVDLAKMVHASQQTIQFIEDGTTKKSKYLPEIANVLGVSYDWLVTGKESSIPQNIVSKGLTDDEKEILETYRFIDNVRKASMRSFSTHLKLEQISASQSPASSQETKLPPIEAGSN
ncbi:MAG: helix-turn-helix domain-containing protein [Arenicella sp.]